MLEQKKENRHKDRGEEEKLKDESCWKHTADFQWCRYRVSCIKAYQSGSWKRLHVAMMADICVDMRKQTQCSAGLQFPQTEERWNLTAMCVLLSPHFRLQNKLKQAPKKISKQNSHLMPLKPDVKLHFWDSAGSCQTASHFSRARTFSAAEAVRVSGLKGNFNPRTGWRPKEKLWQTTCLFCL